MIYPTDLSEAIESFKKIPGIGEKSAERQVLAILKLPEEDVVNFANSLLAIKKNLHPCQICGHLATNDICDICADSERDKKVICILEDFKSVFAFEKSGNYNGTYHVLNGLISPIDGIGPEDINIASLIKRVDELGECEIIVALKASVEGEATTMFIQKLLKDKKIKISRLPYGIPMGAEIDYLDPLSLDKALKDRKVISENLFPGK